MHRNRIVFTTAFVGLVAALWFPAMGTRAQDEGPAAGVGGSDVPPASTTKVAFDCPREVVAGPQRGVEGFGACQRCHASGLPTGGFTLLGQKVQYDKDVWVLYGELPIWGENDRHVQAYAVLHGKRSQKMGEILGVPHEMVDGEKVYQIHRDKRCLACHTGYPLGLLDTDATHPSLVADGVETNNEVKYGVTCEGCHGASSGEVGGGAEGWFARHQITPGNAQDLEHAWRYLPPSEKAEEYGYVDVRSPVARTRMCLSCHLGNAAEGRVVTHEMYAAGHRVLPGFEIESFVRQMPEHWKPFPEKDSNVRDEFLANTRDPLYAKGAYDITNLHLTKSMLVASLVSVAESLRLDAELATDSVAAPVEREMWPEMAQFDCFACHHDLEDGGWRFERQPVLSRPGRPPLREWPRALLDVAVRVVREQQPGTSVTAIENLQDSLLKVQDRVGEHPYGGDPVRFAASACAAASAADDLATLLERESLPHGDARRVIQAIADVARDEQMLWDYDSARQLTWAFQTVLDETRRQHDRSTTEGWELKPLAAQEELERLLADFAPANSRAEERLMTLDLRLARSLKVAVKGEDLDVNEINRGERLVPIRNYDPRAFRAKFNAIAEVLGN